MDDSIKDRNQESSISIVKQKNDIRLQNLEEQLIGTKQHIYPKIRANTFAQRVYFKYF